MSISIETIDQQSFDAFATQQTNFNYLQSPEMAKLRQLRGQAVQFLSLRQPTDANSIMVALLSVKKTKLGKVASIDGGPLGNITKLPDYLPALKSYLKQQNIIYCQITPHFVIKTLTQDGEIISQNPLPNLSPNQTKDLKLARKSFSARQEFQFIKHLPENVESLRQSYNQSARRSLKKAEQNHLKIIEAQEGNEDRFSKIVKILEDTAQRQNFAKKGADYYAKLKQSFGKKVKFFGVEHKIDNDPDNNSEIIAAGVFIIDQNQDKTKSELIYLFGGSKKQFANTGAPTFLQDQAMQLAIQKGYQKYNFYGVSGNFDGSDPVLKFKQSFRGQIEQYAPSFDLIIAPLRYRLLQIL
ncbi:MAG: aminoacyltransferase [Candidatus Nomurabacteria bacterium]|jgi:alanine adding enzyme|nr:aminoacyltransferase [Candidatus Nomurabacteria bacterium]